MEKFLDGNMRGTYPQNARFVDEGKFLSLYTTEINEKVFSLFDKEKGCNLSGKMGNIIEINVAGIQKFCFKRNRTGWRGSVGKNTVILLPTCDIRDARTVVSSIAAISKNTIFGKLAGKTIYLGGYDFERPLALGAASQNDMFIFNHIETRRIFAVGVDIVTASDPSVVRTSVDEVLLHEAAHMLRPRLQTAYRLCHLAVTEAAADERAMSKLFGAAAEINRDYLPAVCDQIKHAAGKPDMERANVYQKVSDELLAETFARLHAKHLPVLKTSLAKSMVSAINDISEADDFSRINEIVYKYCPVTLSDVLSGVTIEGANQAMRQKFIDSGGIASMQGNMAEFPSFKMSKAKGTKPSHKSF